MLWWRCQNATLHSSAPCRLLNKFEPYATPFSILRITTVMSLPALQPVLPFLQWCRLLIFPDLQNATNQVRSGEVHTHQLAPSFRVLLMSSVLNRTLLPLYPLNVQIWRWGARPCTTTIAHVGWIDLISTYIALSLRQGERCSWCLIAIRR